jgi:dihydroorotase
MLSASSSGCGQITTGSNADLCIFDPAAHWRVTPDALKSQSKHTPFAHHEMPGRVRATLVAGEVAYED